MREIDREATDRERLRLRLRLRDAAPDLYEALRALTDDFEARFEQRTPRPRHLGRESIVAARVALAKADGR